MLNPDLQRLEGVWIGVEHIRDDGKDYDASGRLVFQSVFDGRFLLCDYVQTAPASGRVSIMGYGHYVETYRKCPDGKWRISSKSNDRLRVDQVPWTLPEG